MNNVTLMGRLTRDPEVKVSQGGNKVARYTLAVDRRFKRDGEPSADFIPCVAFGKTADFAELYLHQGMKIAIGGRIQTGSYTKNDGTKAYTMDVIVDGHEFCEKKEPTEMVEEKPQPAQESFMDIPDEELDHLPFH